MLAKQRTLLLLLLAVFVVWILPAQLRPEIYPSDDAYFYPQVAWHIAQGHGSTFNEITQTNGYHPLWMLCCVAAAFIANGDKPLLLHLVVMIAQALSLASLYLFYRVGKRLDLKYLPAVLPLLAAFLLSIGMYGSEAHLTVLLLLVVLNLFLRDHATDRGLAILSAVMGLLFLARLDTIFLIGCIFVYLLATSIRQSGWTLKSLTALLLPFAAISGVYLLYNQLTFGHLMPISGALKSAVPPITKGLGYIMRRPRFGLGTVGLPTAIVAILALVLMRFMTVPKQLRTVIRILSIGVLLHACYVTFITDHLTHWTWYYLPGVLNMCIVLGLLADWIQRRLFANSRKTFAVLVSGVAVLIGVSGILRAWSEYVNPEASGWAPLQFAGQNSEKWQIEMAHYIDSQMPPRAALLTFDWAGYIAYHTDLRVVPIDGLMNDFAYQDEIKRTGMHAFVVKHDINYFLGPEFWFPEPPIGMNNIIAPPGSIPDSTQRIDFYAPLYRKYIGSVELASQDSVGRMREVLHNPNVYYYDYRLWRLPSDSSAWKQIADPPM